LLGFFLVSCSSPSLARLSWHLQLSSFSRVHRSPVKRDIKIGRGTHLMHLETMRPALWQENISFLGGNDIAAIAA
jgi:hypothetical protein